MKTERKTDSERGRERERLKEMKRKGEFLLFMFALSLGNNFRYLAAPLIFFLSL